MDLWPLIIPVAVVFAAATSVLVRERRGPAPTEPDRGEGDVASVRLADLDAPVVSGSGDPVIDLTAHVPAGSLGARLRDTAEVRPAAARPIRVMRRRRARPLVAVDRRD